MRKDTLKIENGEFYSVDLLIEELLKYKEEFGDTVELYTEGYYIEFRFLKSLTQVTNSDSDTSTPPR